MFSKKFIPDFSTRKDYKKPITSLPAVVVPAPPPASEYVAVPPQLPPPSIMEFKPVYIKKDRKQHIEPVTFSASVPVPQSGSGYAPDIATTPSLGSSYFASYQDIIASGGAAWSKFPALQNIDISGYNLQGVGLINASGASFSTLSSAYAYVSTLDVKVGDISSLTTRIIDLDGNFLTTDNGAGGELLLNGVPIATLSNISSIADWSFYDAVSTVHMEGQNIDRLGSLKFDGITGTITGLSTINGDRYPNPNGDSSLWANFGAVSSINASNNNLLNVSTLYATDGNVTNVLNVSTVQANYISTSQVQANYISSSQVQAMNGSFQAVGLSSMTVSTINNLEYPPPNSDVSQWATFSAVAKIDVNDLDLNNVSSLVFVGGANKLTTNPSNQLTYNGTVVTTGDNASQWSRYAALQTVAMNGQTLNDTRTITGNGSSLDINVTGVTAQTSLLNMTSENGLQGQINIRAGSGDLNNGGGLVNITAEGGTPSLSGLNGRINMTATYGQIGLVTPVYVGGLIELNATSGPGGGGSSAIRLSAASITSYAGYIGSIGSLAGYNFIYGTGGVNIVAGVIPSIFPNVPGTVYLYGQTGIELDSDTYVSNIYPYFTPGVFPIPNLKLAGRTQGVYKAYVDLFNVSEINYDVDGNSQLNGLKILNFNTTESLIQNLSSFSLTDTGQIVLSTLTGTPGQVVGKDSLGNVRWLDVAAAPVTPDLVVSTLTTAATGYVSTPTAYVSSIVGLSSINGISYPPAVSAGSFITLGGATVDCTSLGEINALANAGQNISITSGNNLNLNSAGGIANAIVMNNGLTVDYTGSVLEFAPQSGTSIIQGQIVGLSTINAQPYPPPFSGTISSITNGTGFVEITPAGAINMTATAGENITIDNTGGSLIVVSDDINLNGLQVGITGQDLNFPLGVGSAVVGQITNLSTINGAPWNTPGPTGPTGPPGPSTSFYPYQADSGATPGSGHISWSNFASQVASTYIRVNHIDQDTVDIDIFLNLIIQGTKLILQDANVSNNYQTWTVSGTPTYNTGSGYAQYPVTLVASGGTSQFANNHQIILAVTGIPGPTGPAGPTGPTGPTGPASVAWVAGGTYSNPNITVPAATNTLISYQSITTFSTTSKYLIMVQFNGVETTAGNIFATIGRSSLVPTAANSTNLSNNSSALTNALSGNGLHIWAESSSTSTTTIICHVVDNPGSIGTFYYSLWVLSTPGISNLATELGTVTVLQIAP